MQKRESHETRLDQELAELRLKGFVLLAHLMHQGATPPSHKAHLFSDLRVAR